MKPQFNEPCNNCKHWSNRSGCKIDRYNSTSMVMFGHCGFCQQRVDLKKLVEKTSK